MLVLSYCFDTIWLKLNKACCQRTDKWSGCSVFGSVTITSVMRKTVNKRTKGRKWFIVRSVATLKVCLSFFEGCRKDD